MTERQTNSVSAQQVADWLEKGEAVLVDVRNPDEFKSFHIAGAHSLPLDSLSDTLKQLPLLENKKVVFQCLLGGRSSKACSIASKALADHDIYNMDGGIASWQNAQLPVVGGDSEKISIFRQVQIVVGLLVLTLVILGYLGFYFAFAIAGFIGMMLAFAGFSGWCGLAMLLQKLPYNNRSQ